MILDISQLPLMKSLKNFCAAAKSLIIIKLKTKNYALATAKQKVESFLLRKWKVNDQPEYGILK